MTSDHEELIRFALEELPSGPTRKPWMTTRALARKIRENQNLRITEDQLEVVLECASTLNERRLRYSMFPSARSLRILWGAVTAIGNQRASSLVLESDDGQNEVSGEVTDDHPPVFVSHNYRDREHVMRLCDRFKSAGISTWISESRIQEGDTIIHEVSNAIESCPLCVLYLSKNSLGSTWVRKEILNTRVDKSGGQGCGPGFIAVRRAVQQLFTTEDIDVA